MLDAKLDMVPGTDGQVQARKGLDRNGRFSRKILYFNLRSSLRPPLRLCSLERTSMSG
jgi:hypothetical protein